MLVSFAYIMQNLPMWTVHTLVSFVKKKITSVYAGKFCKKKKKFVKKKTKQK